MPIRRATRVLRPSDAARIDDAGKGIPEATIGRLPTYHRTLVNLADQSIHTVSSEELAAAAGVTSARLRKDLSFVGPCGVRGVGYEVEALLRQISAALGYAQEWPLVICGMGHLGQALANYPGFGDRGVRVVALIDADPAKIGTTHELPSARITISSPGDLEAVVESSGALIGVIATPASAAQSTCDRLVACGIRSILNFAPVVLTVPENVRVRRVDLFSELQILAFHEQRRQGVTA